MTDHIVNGKAVALDHGIERREFQIRSVDSEKREVTGIAVPWDTEANVGWYTEKVARGAVEESDDARLWWDHQTPIGRITKTRDADEGWEITAVISETATGNEAYTLLRDGVVDRFSIGFEPIESVVDEESEVVTRTRIRVREVSLVPIPAYEGAKVSQVRAATDNKKEVTMGDTVVTKADLDEVRTGIEDLSRRFDKGIEVRKEEGSPIMEFRSFGEYVKALASGDERAQRAFAGAVSGDTVVKNGWVGDIYRIMQERQRITNLFQHSSTLPAEGMNIEYGVVESDTTQVGVQADEGDDLLYGKIKIGTKTAPVKTLGGWSSLSRQAIERTSVNVLDLTFTALANKYAKAIETLARQTITTAHAATGDDALDVVTADFATQDGVVESLIDLVEKFDDNGLNFDGLLVSRDVFLGLLAVPATDRILQVSQAPNDKVGTLTVRSLEANLAGVKVTLMPNAAAGFAVGYDTLAVKTLESPGAPLRLQDENVVNLTKEFSVYGYAASFVQFQDGLIKVDTAGAGA